MSALAALGIVLLIAFALILGLRVGTSWHAPGALVSVSLQPPEPPRPQEPEHPVRPAETSAPKGAPSPRNLRNKATQVIAPPVRPLILPPPFVVATQAASGDAASSGASDRAGPGQGAGGIGDGTGGGGYGGDGDGGGAVIGPRQIRGRLSFRDMPEDMLEPGGRASVGVRYLVNVDGRVSDCRADDTSGFAALDALTCRLIEERFRFRPGRNRAGRPVRTTVVETHTWFVQPDEGGDLSG